MPRKIQVYLKAMIARIKDVNYSSSVFLVLVLVKELQLAGHSEAEAFKLIFKDFMQANPNKKPGKMYSRPHLICL